MKLILLAVLSFCASLVSAQNAYKISYDYVPKASDHRTIELIFNDTASLSYICLKGFSPGKNTKDFRGKIIHHAIYNLKNRNAVYSVMGVNKKKAYMFIAKPEFRTWQQKEYEKNIAGYSCKAALFVNADGDSSLVYYTTELAAKAAPLFGFDQIEGVPLEIYQQKGDNLMHLLASAVTKGDYQFSLPDLEIVSEEERNKRVVAGRKMSEPVIVIDR